MLLASRDDMVVPPRHTEWLAAAMPAARRLPPFEGGHAFFQYDARAGERGAGVPGGREGGLGIPRLPLDATGAGERPTGGSGAFALANHPR